MAQVVQLPYEDLESVPVIREDGVTWGATDVRCRVEYSNTRVLFVKLASDKRFMAGRDYRLTVTAYNPSLAPPGLTSWKLETFNDEVGNPDNALDESDVPGFEIN